MNKLLAVPELFSPRPNLALVAAKGGAEEIDPAFGHRRSSRSTNAKKPDSILDFVLGRYAKGRAGLDEVVLTLYYGNISMAYALEAASRLWGAETDLTSLMELVNATRKKLQEHRLRSLATCYPYVYLESAAIKSPPAGGDWMVHTAVGVTSGSRRELLAVVIKREDDGGGWAELLRVIRQRGVAKVNLFVGDYCPRLQLDIARYYRHARYQAHVQKLEREIFGQVPLDTFVTISGAFSEIANATSALRAQERADYLIRELRAGEHHDLAENVANATRYQFSYFHFPRSHWPKLRSHFPLAASLTDYRRWVRLCGSPLKPEALLDMAEIVFLHAESLWNTRLFVRFPAAAKKAAN